MIGLMIVLPVFFQVTGDIGLYSGAVFSSGLVLPLSYFVLPLMLMSLLRGSKVLLNFGESYLFFMVGFFVWVVLLGLSSALSHQVALLYAVQWILPFFASFYGAALVSRERRFRKFFHGFLIGTVVSVCVLVSVAGIEALFLGGLAGGRMSSNAVIPGFYQLYNYVPVGMAVAALFCVGVLAYRRGIRFKMLGLAIWSLCFVFLVVVASRGALLVFVAITLYFLYVMRKTPAAIFSFVGIIALGTVVVVATDFRPTQLTAFEKFSEIIYGEERVRLASRDSIVSRALFIYQENALLGTAMVPPGTVLPKWGEFSSAHNYYIDVLLWAGPIGLILVLGLVLIISKDALRFLMIRPRSVTGNGLVWLCHVTAPLILSVFLISNNLRVPMRQPYSGILIFLFIGIFLGALRGLRKGRVVSL